MEKTLPATTVTLPFSLKPHFRHYPHSKPILSLYTKNPHRISPYTCSCRRPTATVDEENGEFGRNRRRKRWSNDVSSSSETGYGVFQELVDSIWIFKVFRFYGWWLLPILISLLLATGLKAFLLALAVPIGLSIVSLAFNKLWDTLVKPKRGFKAKKKKTRGRPTSNIDIEEEYQSWVPKDDGESDKGGESSSSFKGWDELDGVKEFEEGTTRKSARVGRSRREGRFIRRERGGEIPLLLRLLIAVFPFLGSWTKML